MWTGEAKLKRVEFWQARTRKEYALLADFALIEGQLDLNLYCSVGENGHHVEWEWAEWDTGSWPGEGRWVGEVMTHWPLEELSRHHLFAEEEPLRLTLLLAQVQAETEVLEARLTAKMRSVDWADERSPASVQAWAEALQAELVQP